ncbi:hypothetical protein Cs7R123_08570 [Catellatospora sp. TT07R-123]|uniref:hypothetical protein n=1 Tax=Catellatospora sp. TT07R-123 TaxID=2733863 RepID=UPI001B02525D|nr:hypothetical protein [Catellatospora sp. TT07R-123]GHJ43515.1 hypothetical protein Cs7R123_08570 [Catellatospora sp. TT07R-123]
MFHWTWPRTLICTALAALVAAFSLLARHEGWPVADTSLIFAAVLVIVAFSGRLDTVRRQRWDAVDKPVPAAVTARGGRAVVRRIDVPARIIFGIFAVGGPLAVWSNSSSDVPGATLIVAALVGSLCAASAVPAFAYRMVVTPTHVHVDKAFVRHLIPRQAIRSLERGSSGELKIIVDGRPPVAFPAGTAFGGAAWNQRPAQLIAAGRLEAALAAVPMLPADSPAVERRPRGGLIAAVAASVLCFATTAALIYSGALPSQL